MQQKYGHNDRQWNVNGKKLKKWNTHARQLKEWNTFVNLKGVIFSLVVKKKLRFLSPQIVETHLFCSKQIF